jgi:hypothetical protein
MCGSAASRSTTVSTIRDLPIPGSPEISTIWPSPAFACSQRRVSSATSSSRPTRGIVAAHNASKRLATKLARSAANACTGRAMPLKLLQIKQIADKFSRGFADAQRRLADGPRGSASHRQCRAPAPRPCQLASRAFSKFESYGMLEAAASRGWKAKDAIEWFHGIGRLVRRPRPRRSQYRHEPTTPAIARRILRRSPSTTPIFSKS